MSLLDFLRDWQCWALSRPISNSYDTKRGLCASIGRYTMGEDGLQREELRVQIRDHLFALLNEQYVPGSQRSSRDCNTSSYPFGGYSLYKHEERTGTAHLNPARLAWVAKTIKELENEHQQA